MKFIQKFIQKPVVTQKPMGRWNLEYCNKKLNNKVDLSNEDHCGPCGQYAITKSEKISRDNDINNNNNNNKS